MVRPGFAEGIIFTAASGILLYYLYYAIAQQKGGGHLYLCASCSLGTVACCNILSKPSTIDQVYFNGQVNDMLDVFFAISIAVLFFRRMMLLKKMRG